MQFVVVLLKQERLMILKKILISPKILDVSDGDRTVFRGVVRSRPRVVRSWSDRGVGDPIHGPDLRFGFLSQMFQNE